MKRKSEKIIDALGGINDNYVLECLPLLFAPPKRRRGGWLLLAACLALCVLAAPKVWLYLSEHIESNPIAEEVQPNQGDKYPNPPDEETVHPELPVLTLGTDYVGNGGGTLRAMDAAELLVGSPIDAENAPETMPVYRNPYPTNEVQDPEGWTPDEEAMEAALLEIAKQFGVDGEIVWYSIPYQDVSISDGTWQIDVAGDLSATVVQVKNMLLPEGCGSDTLEAAAAAAAYLKDQFGEMLGFVQPEAVVTGGDYSYLGEQCYHVVLYDGSGTPEEQMRNRWLHSAAFYLNQDQVSFIQIQYAGPGEALGDYPVLSLEEAEALLQQGYGMTACPERPEELEIAKADLIYLNMTWFETYVPVYRFLVKMPGEDASGCSNYGVFYLPAVRPAYISDNRFWKTPDVEQTFEEKVWSAPDPDKIGDKAKEAFLAYFQENPEVMEAYGDYDLEFHKDWNATEMWCSGPLMAVTGDRQVFRYDRDRGVWLERSETWSPETVDYSEAVYRMLLERSPEDTKDYDAYVREAFAYYYLAHPTELQLLPVFEKDVPPDWNLLSLYILLQTKPDSTFTASAFRGMVDQYLGACTYTDGSSDYMTYENGGYTVDAMGLNLDTVYYRLESLEMLEDGVYQAAFEGFALPYEEIINEGYRNPQTQNMKLLVEQTGLPSDSLEWSDVKQRILDSTGRASKSLEEQGFEVTDRVTVTFRLQDGGNPMQYLSCRRGFQLVAQWDSHWLMESCTRDGTEVRLILMPAREILDSYWVEMDVEVPGADEFPMDAYLTLDGCDGDLAWGEAGLYRYENGRLAQLYDSGVCAAVQDGGGYLIVTREKGRRVLYTSGGVSFHAGDMVVQIDSKGNSVTLADASGLDLCLTGVYRGNDGSLYVEASENWGMADLYRYLYRVSNGRLIACATEGGNGYSDRSEAEAAAEQERLDAIYEAREAR